MKSQQCHEECSEYKLSEGDHDLLNVATSLWNPSLVFLPNVFTVCLLLFGCTSYTTCYMSP